MPIVDMDTLRNDNAEPQEEFLTDEEQDAMGGESEEEGHKRVKRMWTKILTTLWWRN